MRAVRYTAFRATPEVVTVGNPSCPDDGVLVAVAATGLCRSDWHGWMGHDPDIRLPHVPGHEFAGHVVAIGPDVRGRRVGERVTTSFIGACGRCVTCRRGEQQVCDNQRQPGFTGWGSFAELVAVPQAEPNLVRLPDDMPMDVAAILGCRFATAYRAVVHRAQVRAGDWVVVHGCGGVGLSAVMVAAARGARVIAVDLAEPALHRAEQFGATAVIDASRTEVVTEVRELTDGGAQVSIDAFGSAAAATASIGCLGKRGRHVQIGLLAEHGGQVEVPMSAVLSGELDIVGSHGMPAHDYPEMMRAIAAGELDPGRLIERQVGLAEAAALLADGDSTARPGITIVDPSR